MDRPATGKPTAPAALSWSAGGPNPVAFHRSAWDRDASFVAIKGGSPSLNQAHMDVGAFVMDAMGLRWADDLGSQDCHSLEKDGVDLWNKTPESERWSVFRIGPASHNVLQIDGRPQNVAGHAAPTLTKAGSTVVNLAETYAGQLAAAHRDVALQSDRSVRVQDEIQTLGRPSKIRWAMVTRADVSLDGPGAATLKQGGKTLAFRALEPAGAKLEIYPTDPPPGKFDARNEGTRLIGFTVQATAKQTQRLVAQLVPGAAQADELPITPLAGW